MTTNRPLLLDLFCGAGGASMGYYRAGFDVLGVDNQPMPRYPFDFIQADEFLNRMIQNPAWSGVSAIHASPPCQGYSVTRSVNPHAHEYPQLIKPVRGLLQLIGLPYVIENVEGAKKQMVEPVTLCGSQFNLWCGFNGELAYLRRHRLFEVNWPLPDAGDHNHIGYAFPVFGHGPGGHIRGKGGAATARELMGIDWMTRKELDESIPPAYATYVGAHLRPHLALAALCGPF